MSRKVGTPTEQDELELGESGTGTAANGGSCSHHSVLFSVFDSVLDREHEGSSGRSQRRYPLCVADGVAMEVSK